VTTARVIIDGSYGEGGGQIVRTALSLSALTGRPFTLERIRARRSNPGLGAQHLAAVRATALVCQAEVEGDEMRSRQLSFTPTTPPEPGEYTLDISDLAGIGSAGATTLLFQTVFVPLALSPGPSTLHLRGGTHVRWSPPYHYLSHVYLPLVRRIGLEAQVSLDTWGWYPASGGSWEAHIPGTARLEALRPLTLLERGALEAVVCVSAASNLPEGIIKRQTETAVQRLKARRIKPEIEETAPPSPGPGTILFLLAEYEHVAAGFAGFGRLRYPAERVAEDAVDAFEDYHGSHQALDPHLADQVILPLILAPGSSTFTTSAVTQHLLTVAWLVQQFSDRRVEISGEQGEPGTVTIT
jgi:RNA 3'-terminal phosphate cyclase (ATP)